MGKYMMLHLSSETWMNITDTNKEHVLEKVNVIIGRITFLIPLTEEYESNPMYLYGKIIDCIIKDEHTRLVLHVLPEGTIMQFPFTLNDDFSPPSVSIIGGLPEGFAKSNKLSCGCRWIGDLNADSDLILNTLHSCYDIPDILFPNEDYDEYLMSSLYIDHAISILDTDSSESMKSLSQVSTISIPLEDIAKHRENAKSELSNVVDEITNNVKERKEYDTGI